jgi:hypothetical protein
MTGPDHEPVIRANYSGISGEGQESARNLPFAGVIWRTVMPNLPFPSLNRSSPTGVSWAMKNRLD